MLFEHLPEEENWERGEWLEQMLAHLRKQKFSLRKFRLLAVACCRSIWDRLPNKECRAAVEAAEAWADGVLSQKQLLFARQPAERVARRLSEEARELEAERGATWVQRCREYEAAMAAVEAAQPRVDRVRQALWYASAAAGALRLVTLAQQVILVRDIFGNPFRPVTFSPSWRTDTALALARQMYESREFGVMPILADALQDAGCDNDDILNHCRDAKQVHVRGCWVVDLVLNKS
jgi:hypothetical protein